MGRLTYVCATCSEHFTRKHSARRHNQNLHDGNADIVRLIDYLADRSSGLYTPNNPFWFKRNNPYGNIGPATIPDTVADTYLPNHIPQQTPLGISQYSANPKYTPGQIMNVQRYGTGLSQNIIVKIDELRRLMNKYPKYNMNPNGIIQWAIHTSINDDKLQQLRNLDSLAKC